MYTARRVLSLPVRTFIPNRAISSYDNLRYIALQNDEKGVGPLASYFKGEVLHGRDTDIFTSNMCELVLFFKIGYCTDEH